MKSVMRTETSWMDQSPTEAGTQKNVKIEVAVKTRT